MPQRQQVTDYRIVCTNQEPAWVGNQHAHIVAVGTGGNTGWDRKWPLADVIQAIDQGHRFFTVSPSTGQTALVQKYTCSLCVRTHIRSTPDAVRDNNLDNLSTCAMRAAGA